jgi:hypothetical protein
MGVAPEQPALLVQVLPPGDGWQVPCVSQVKPVGQGVLPLHWATHWPLSQTVPTGQSLFSVQALPDAVQVPFTQTWPLAQSDGCAQGQGPLSPPQVMHLFW